MRRAVLAMAVLVAAGGGHAAAAALGKAKTETCAVVTKGEIERLFDRWNAALRTGDPRKVTVNYLPDAVLLPTVSNKPRTNHNEINDYFVHFLESKPHGRIDSRHVTIGCNTASDVGTYTFALRDKHGKASEVHARYTFIYTYRHGHWLIAHHHSSAMPETAAAH